MGEWPFCSPIWSLFCLISYQRGHSGFYYPFHWLAFSFILLSQPPQSISVSITEWSGLGPDSHLYSSSSFQEE
jgi:hypothetical protein